MQGDYEPAPELIPAEEDEAALFEKRSTRRHQRWMYHGTQNANLPRILAEGLLPQERKLLADTEYGEAVYLFDSCKDRWEWPHEVLLRIDTSGLALYWDAYGSMDKWGWAWRYEGIIGPERIFEMGPKLSRAGRGPEV